MNRAREANVSLSLLLQSSVGRLIARNVDRNDGWSLKQAIRDLQPRESKVERMINWRHWSRISFSLVSKQSYKSTLASVHTNSGVANAFIHFWQNGLNGKYSLCPTKEKMNYITQWPPTLQPLGASFCLFKNKQNISWNRSMQTRDLSCIFYYNRS